MLHFVFTRSESNVRHGGSVQQGPIFEPVRLCLTACKAAAFPPSNPRETRPQTVRRPQVSQVHARLSLYRFRKQRSARPVPLSNSANPAAGLSKATTLAAHASAMRF